MVNGYSSVRAAAWQALVHLEESLSPLLSPVSAQPKSIIPYCIPWIESLSNHDLLEIQNGADPIALLALAMCEEPLYIKIPDGRTACIDLSLGSFQRCHIEVGKHAVLHLNASGGSSNTLFSFNIDRGGFVSVEKQISSDAITSCCQKIDLSSDASYQERSISAAHVAKNSLQATLRGEGSSIRLKSLALVPRLAQTDDSVTIDHQAQHSRSFVFHKVVVAQGGSSRFHSLGQLRSQGDISHSYIHHLTLGKDTHVYAKPSFEIYYDDVEASHGCTSKEIDDEFLVYASSRGINPQQAKRLFVEGFCDEILDGLPLPQVFEENFPTCSSR